MTTTLHYIYDPLCGWCYAAAPLVKVARSLLPVQAHGGGMMTGTRRQTVTPQLRNYVMPHDQRIAQMTGQPFGEAYFDGLLRDTTAVFDSAPPTAAMLAARQIAARELDMIARLQAAHYVEGRRISDRDVLLDIAVELGLDRALFATSMDAQTGALDAHFRATHRLMNEVGASGFPSFVLETEGARRLIDASRFLGKPEAFAGWLQSAAPGAVGAGASAVCGPDSCAI